MNSLFIIRRLELEDLEEYIRLRREGIQIDPIGFGKAYSTEGKATRSLYAAFLAPSRTRSIWGAFYNDMLVGMVRLETEEQGTRKTIYSLYVCPERRHQGIGRRLLCQAIREATGDPMVDDIFLNVITKNESALALYRSVGFRECGLLEDTFSMGGECYSEYRMRKYLLKRRTVAARAEAGSTV